MSVEDITIQQVEDYHCYMNCGNPGGQFTIRDAYYDLSMELRWKELTDQERSEYWSKQHGPR